MTRLSAEDMNRWMTVLAAIPKDPLGLISWLVNSVKSFFPFRTVLLVRGEQVAGQIRVTHVLSHGHTDEDALTDFGSFFDARTRGSVSWWLEHRTPFFIDPDAPPPFASTFEVQEMRRLNTGPVAAHGVVNATGTAGTYFAFRLAQPPSDWHLDALRLIAPMLNDLFHRNLAASGAVNSAHASLTPRQKDIVRLAALGLSSKGIARELVLADKTVRNQLSEIYERLGVRDCRSMLIAVR